MLLQIILKIFLKKKLIDGEYIFLYKLEKKGIPLKAYQIERLHLLKECRELLQVASGVLTDDECFVIQRHLVDGIDWPRIATECNNKWGECHTKTHRTLMGYQKSALLKIALFFNEILLDYSAESKGKISAMLMEDKNDK